MLCQKNWVETELGRIVFPRKGKKPNNLIEEEVDNSIPYILIDQLEGKENRLFTTDKNVTVVDENDVLVVWDGSIGKNASGINGALGSTLVSMTPLGKIPTGFVEYIIKEKQNFIKETSTGVGLQHINKNFLKECIVPLPPLPEQKRIVAKLDVLFGQIETIKKYLDKIPQLLKNFRQQVLTQAVTGKLTEKWREGKELENASELFNRMIESRIEEFNRLCEVAKKKGERRPTKIFMQELPKIEEIKTNLPKSWGQTNIHFLAFVTKLAGFEYTNYFDVSKEGEIPIIRAQNVQMGRFEDKNRNYISKKTSDFLVRSQLFGRELLMVFIGAGTGNVCLAPSGERWHLAPNVAKIDFDFVDRKYIFYYLQSKLGIVNVLSRVKATAQPSLSMETIRDIITIVPPISEQKEIVCRIETLFSKAEKIELRYQNLKEKLDQLPQAILHKAFKGELVPQLPTDGDAKDLLKEILALKKELNTKRTKKKSK